MAVIDTSASKRYCFHMNKDHADVLLYYVQYFAKQTEAQKAHLVKIDTKGMDIMFSGRFGKTGKCRVCFEPEIESANEVRPRLVTMMNEALHGLGLSEYQVDKFENPGPSANIIIGLIVSFYVLKVAPITWLPTGLADLKVLLIRKPLYSWIASAALVIHALEVMLFLRPKVRKYRLGSKNALKWYVTGFLGGIASIRQFDQMIASKIKTRMQQGFPEE